MKSACNIAKSVGYNLKKYRIAFIKSYHESYSINGLHKNTPKFLKVEFAKLDIRLKGKSIFKNEEIIKNYFDGLNLCYKYYQNDFTPDFSIKEKEILKSIKNLEHRLCLSIHNNPWYYFYDLKVIIDKYPLFFKMRKVQHFIISYKYYLNKFNENNKPKVYIPPTYSIGSNHWSSISRIKVTDTITKKEFIFENANDKELLKMFSPSCISRTIITGKLTKVNKLSKYKNPCFISTT